MKIEAIQGYAIALGYLVEYEKEHTLTDELNKIKFYISTIVKGYVERNRLNLMKLIDVSYKKLMVISGYDKEVAVSVLTFVLQLVLKNPMSAKHKELTNIALKLNKEHLFNKDNDVVMAKKVVNRFYNKETEELKNG